MATTAESPRVTNSKPEVWKSLIHPVPAADIEQPIHVAKADACQHFIGHEVLRGGHQRGVFRRVRPPLGRPLERAGIGPEARQRSRLLAIGAQQGEGIGKIGVEQAVMANHRLHTRIGRENSALFAQHPVIGGGFLGQHMRATCAQQGEGGRLREPHPRSDSRRAQRAVLQDVEQPAFNIGAQDLRIGEACEQIESARRPARRNPSDDREPRGPVLKFGGGEQAVAARHITEPEGGKIPQLLSA